MPGVAEVAAVGGFGRQYQISIDPDRLRLYGIPLNRVVDAVRGSNSEVGGRVIEVGGTEYMVRGRGYAKSVGDFENIFLATAGDGTPVRIKDVGQVVIGPEQRRGVADLDGKGDVVSGIVVMRQGENALDVIEGVKARLEEIAPGLPPGVKVVGIYDRSDLIRRAIGTLTTTLLEIVATVSLIVLFFLWHVPSALIPILTIPLSVLIAFGLFRLMGVTANIMSLSGIAIAVGILVDGAIVVVEQAHKSWTSGSAAAATAPARSVIVRAVREVAPASFFALLVVAVAFLPVLTLEAQEGRLFKPLAHATMLAVVVAAVLAVTLNPALRVMLSRERPFSFRPGRLASARQRRPRRACARRVGTPGEPPVDSCVPTRRPVEPAVEVGCHRRRIRARAHQRPRVPAPRRGIHAAAGRGLALLHAVDDTCARHRRSAEASRATKNDHQDIPRGRSRAGQGWPGGDRHRPRAALDVRDGHRPQADIRMA